MIEDNLRKWFKRYFNRCFYVLYSSISDVRCVIQGISNFKALRVDDFNFMKCIVDRLLNFAFFQFHSLNISNQYSLSIFERILYSIEQCDDTFLTNRYILNKDFDRFLTIFIKNFKLFTQIVDYSTSESYTISADELYILLSANS